MGHPALGTVRRVVLGATLLTALPAAPLSAQDTALADLRERLELLAATDRLELGGEVVGSGSLLVELYTLAGYRALWNPGTVAELVVELAALGTDGLDPADYHTDVIRRLAATAGSASEDAVALDLLATDAFLLATADLRHGRAPASLRGAATSAVPPRDATATLAALRRGDAGRAFAEARPDHWIYRGLVQALAQLARIEAAGGWGALPDGPTMRPDSVDERVPALRRRLVLSGDLPEEAVERGTALDAALAAAVRRFQHRHGLNEDGVVGKATLGELNVPVETRIRQVRTNLERARWALHDLPSAFVAVNVAGQRVYLVRGDEVVFETRAIVGRTATKTPVFRATMRTIDLNPTWTVPPGIVGEVLSAIRKDPAYLAEHDMRVIDRSGRTVSASGIDFSRYSGRSFPWVFRQAAGPANPLGQIKFLFPNPYNVYLHDTPARQLFEQEQRTFSHGCIRVRDPLALAVHVLDDPERWSRAALEEAIAEGRTRTIELERPLPVLVLYWTASADLHGELHFYRDVYRRDPALEEALGAR